MRVIGYLSRRLGHRSWFAALMSRILPPIDRATARLTGDRVVLAQAAAPTLLLRRQGAKDVPLLFVTDGIDLVVAATNWGRPHHPAWSSALLRDPAATVVIRGASSPVRAELLDDHGIARVWPRLVEIWPAFDTYRARSGRTIRVFRLRPPEVTPSAC